MSVENLVLVVTTEARSSKKQKRKGKQHVHCPVSSQRCQNALMPTKRILMLLTSIMRKEEVVHHFVAFERNPDFPSQRSDSDDLVRLLFAAPD